MYVCFYLLKMEGNVNSFFNKPYVLGVTSKYSH